MAPLLVASVAALAVIIERLVVLRPRRILDVRLIRMISKSADSGTFEEIRKYCRGQCGPFHNIIRRAIESRRPSRSAHDEAVSQIGRQESRTLERNLVVLEIIAQAAPLLGLLGTVIGMIEIFAELSAPGSGPPSQALALGISKALITTVAGLVVAIPSLVGYLYFSNVVDDCVLEMEKHTSALVDGMHKTPVEEEEDKP